MAELVNLALATVANGIVGAARNKEKYLLSLLLISIIEISPVASPNLFASDSSRFTFYFSGATNRGQDTCHIGIIAPDGTSFGPVFVNDPPDFGHGQLGGQATWDLNEIGTANTDNSAAETNISVLSVLQPLPGEYILEVRSTNSGICWIQFDSRDSSYSSYAFAEIFQGYLARGEKRTLGITFTPNVPDSFEFAMQTAIQIKPDGSTSPDPEPVNPKSKGKTPVAILADGSFDPVAQLDPSSITFGITGDETSRSHCNEDGEDVDGDGDLDLACHFHTNQLGVKAGDTELVLKGAYADNKPPFRIVGRAQIKTVPE